MFWWLCVPNPNWKSKNENFCVMQSQVYMVHTSKVSFNICHSHYYYSFQVNIRRGTQFLIIVFLFIETILCIFLSREIILLNGIKAFQTEHYCCGYTCKLLCIMPFYIRWNAFQYISKVDYGSSSLEFLKVLFYILDNLSDNSGCLSTISWLTCYTYMP